MIAYLVILGLVVGFDLIYLTNMPTAKCAQCGAAMEELSTNVGRCPNGCMS